jgi:hypothetical protein
MTTDKRLADLEDHLIHASAAGWALVVSDVRGELKQLHAWLAECYRLTGADPDGNEDWRLAPYAVQEVKRLREDSDHADPR